MSLAGVRAGLYTHLSTCGPFASHEISACDYGIIERTSGCAIIFTPTGEHVNEPLTHSGTGVTVSHMTTWHITGELYIRFTGDSPTFLSKVWGGIDDIQTTINKDVSLGNSVDFAYLSSMSYDVNRGYEIGGFDYGVVGFVVACQDLIPQ